MNRPILLLCALTLGGCAAVPAAVPDTAVLRLLAHPQFPAARAAAPVWSADALRTINDLEYQLASARAK